MRFLRTASRARLLTTLGAAALLALVLAAIAVAASGSGPVPPPKPLAQAIRAGLAAPKVQGITAQISFTNHLIDSSDIQGSDPLLSGATGRVWLSADGRVRLELQSDSGDAQVVVNGRSFWAYDPSSRTVYRATLPAERRPAGTHRHAVPTVAQIETGLNRLARHLSISGFGAGQSADRTDVAGHAAYSVQVSPKRDGGLLGAAELAWDAANGVPLRFSLFARGSSSPVIELAATGISFGPVAASVFTVSPPSGAKVVTVATPTPRQQNKHRGHGHHPAVTGVGAVARKLPFKLSAPASLAGFPRRAVTLLSRPGSPAALVSYGEGLGGVTVIEGRATATKPGSPGDRHSGLTLPTVSVGGATGQELDTALGSMIRFTRGGVAYTVVGSVAPGTAKAAARGL